MAKYCRHHSHVQHKKAWEAFDEAILDFQALFRTESSRRSVAMSLDPWDEQWCCSQRSWKSYRDHQYTVRKDRSHQSSARFGQHMARRDHWHLEHRYCSWRPCKHCKAHQVEYHVSYHSFTYGW